MRLMPFGLRALGCALLLILAAGSTSPAADNSFPTNQVGGPTGTPFNDRCTYGDVMVGFNYVAGKALNQISALCHSITSDGRWTGVSYTLNTFGQFKDPGSAVAHGNPQCPTDNAIRALTVYYDTNGDVHHVIMSCAPVFGGNQFVQTTTGNSGGDGYYHGDASCDGNAVAVGWTGAAGGLITRLGLLCELQTPTINTPPPAPPPPAPPPPPPQKALPVTNNPPPLAVNNGNGDNGNTGNGNGNGNGNNGGGTTTSTDTTIYDQPGGNEVAYLQDGDAVTIVNCDGNGWCKISKPKKGYVWGDDLNK